MNRSSYHRRGTLAWVRGAADAVFDILTALNRANIKSRTEEYANLKDKVNSITKKLAALQSEIDSIIYNVTVATSVVQAIGKGLDFAATFLCSAWL